MMRLGSVHTQILCDAQGSRAKHWKAARAGGVGDRRLPPTGRHSLRSNGRFCTPQQMRRCSPTFSHWPRPRVYSRAVPGQVCGQSQGLPACRTGKQHWKAARADSVVSAVTANRTAQFTLERQILYTTADAAMIPCIQSLAEPASILPGCSGPSLRTKPRAAGLSPNVRRPPAG